MYVQKIKNKILRWLGLMLFSFSSMLYAVDPGGVAGNLVWLKSSTGYTTSDWSDGAKKWGFLDTGTLNSEANALNFYPKIVFDGENTILSNKGTEQDIFGTGARDYDDFSFEDEHGGNRFIEIYTVQETASTVTKFIEIEDFYKGFPDFTTPEYSALYNLLISVGILTYPEIVPVVIYKDTFEGGMTLFPYPTGKDAIL